MDKNPLHKGVLTKNSIGIGPVTREKVQARAHKLAVPADRVDPRVAPVDYERAKREPTGESDIDRQEAVLDSVPAAKRWDPRPDSTGHQAPESSSEEEEDDEGRNESAQLVDEGVMAAERDQRLQSARAAGKKDQAQP